MSLGICPTCKFPIRINVSERVLFCSEFCAETSLGDRKLLLELQPGDFGVYPCAECGCIVEDAYEVDGICGNCSPTRLLRQCLAELVEPSALANEVRSYIATHSLKGA